MNDVVLNHELESILELRELALNLRDSGDLGGVLSCVDWARLFSGSKLRRPHESSGLLQLLTSKLVTNFYLLCGRQVSHGIPGRSLLV